MLQRILPTKYYIAGCRWCHCQPVTALLSCCHRAQSPTLLSIVITLKVNCSYGTTQAGWRWNGSCWVKCSISSSFARPDLITMFWMNVLRWETIETQIYLIFAIRIIVLILNSSYNWASSPYYPVCGNPPPHEGNRSRRAWLSVEIESWYSEWEAAAYLQSNHKNGVNIFVNQTLCFGLDSNAT